jgi:type I restriction enzyme S subunit
MSICRKVTSGGTPLTSHSEYYGGTIPWLRTQEVKSTHIRDTEIKITKEGLANSSAKWIPKHCVIVAMYGATAGQVAINEIELTTNQACCNLEINSDKADYNFVYYAIQMAYERLKSLSSGTGQPNLNAGIIKNFDLKIPSVSKQKSTVKKIKQLEGRITALENRLIDLRMQKQSIAAGVL